MVIWLTGLAGSGKTTIGKAVYESIKNKYPNTVFLDGDVFREVIGSYGYSLEERLIVAKKISNLCKHLELQNIRVVCSTISLFHEVQAMNRNNFKEYYEVYITVKFDELVQRDKKGLYSRALKGEIRDVVGVDLTFEAPKNPSLILDNSKEMSLDDNIKKILELIESDKG